MSDPRLASPTGLSRRTAVLLAYVGLWVGAAVLLWVERDDRAVRVHAWQSVLALGGLWLAGIACWAGAFLLLAVSGNAFRALIWIGTVAWAAMILIWGACLYRAVTDGSWRLPLVGPIADRWAGI